MADGEGFTISDAEPPEDPPSASVTPHPRRRDKLALLLCEVDLWRSPDGVAHASVPWKKHHEHMRVASRDFRNWILTRFYLKHGGGLSGQALAETISLAEARALASGEVRQPWRRVAWEAGLLFLDLGGGDANGERRAVEVSAEGWRVLDPEHVPVAFLRAPDMLPLPVPEADAAKPEDLRTFVNVENDDDLALIWAWLVNAARPFAEGGSYPILLLHGEQGSGKTGSCRVLQALVDPSSLTGRTLSRDERELFITAANRHLVAFDNISSVGDSLADCLCRLSTGGGFSARALHTDGDEAIFIAVRPMLINGIPASILGRPDLADRALNIELLPLKERREEREMREAFMGLRPGLLGLLLDGLSAAVRNGATTKIEDPPRMIDAAVWAEAAAAGLGIEAGRIPAAWRANRDRADRAALEVNDLARAVLALLDELRRERNKSEWRGEPADLYRKLCDLAGERVTKGKSWPSNVNGMGNSLKRLAPAMRRVHQVSVTHGKSGSDSRRWWSVCRV
jgi:hypothetical protein